MRKSIIITCCIVVLGLTVVSLLLPVIGAKPEGSSSLVGKAASSPITPATQRYTLKEYQGNLAVYLEGVDQPFRITDVDVRTLPQMDREALSDGIEANGIDELNRLLEDYCS